MDVLFKNQLQSTFVLATLHFYLKILFLSCLGDLFIKVIRVFGDIWKYNEEIRQLKFQ